MKKLTMIVLVMFLVAMLPTNAHECGPNKVWVQFPWFNLNYDPENGVCAPTGGGTGGGNPCNLASACIQWANDQCGMQGKPLSRVVWTMNNCTAMCGVDGLGNWIQADCGS